MKKLLLFIPFLIIAMVLVAGCSSNNDNQTAPQDQQPPVGGAVPVSPPDIVAVPTPAVPSRVTVIPTPVQQPVAATQRDLGALCGELVTCGDLPVSSGVVSIPSTRCPELNNMVLHRDKKVVQCFRDSYIGTTDGRPTADVEYIKLLCTKGVGSPGYCEKYGATLGERQRV
jgi:hypothetical protein